LLDKISPILNKATRSEISKMVASELGVNFNIYPDDCSDSVCNWNVDDFSFPALHIDMQVLFQQSI